MCLFIKSDQDRNEKDLKRWFGSRTKFAYVYKILRTWPETPSYKSVWYSNFEWDFNKTKIYQVIRPAKPTKDELKIGEIGKGFHVYASLKTAKEVRGGNLFEIVVKFRVNREDIVAIQNNRTPRFNLTELVCTKLEFVKVIDD
jgi:hypothetical protein